MRFDLAKLPNDIAALHQIIVSQAADMASERDARRREAELAAAKAGLMAKALEIEKLKLQIARLRRQQFGRSSEKMAREIEQLELRLEELEAEERQPRPAVPDASARDEAEPTLAGSKAKKSARRPLPAHLPRREVVHEPSCTCPTCGGEMRKVGEDVTEILDYIPGRFEVIRHVRPAFSCRRCESMVQAPMPSLPIERGQPGAGLLGACPGRQILRSPAALSAVRHLCPRGRRSRPRDAGRLGRQDGGAGHRPWSRPSPQHVMAAEKLHADDTPVPVLAPGTGKTKTGRLWVYVRDERPYGGRRRRRSSTATRPIARASIRARIWPSFHGFLQADGYAGFGAAL